VKKNNQKDSRENLSNRADRTTAAIDLDFDDALLLAILDSVLGSKAKRPKRTRQPSRS